MGTETGGYMIGRLAKATGVSVETIRYYERIGLLRGPARTSGGYRIYGAEYLHRLAFVRHSRELGFALEAIRDLLELSDDPNRSCEEADRIARAHLSEVESRIARLTGLRSELRRMIEQCRRDKVAHCRIIETLADHAAWLRKEHPPSVTLRGPGR